MIRKILITILLIIGIILAVIGIIAYQNGASFNFLIMAILGIMLTAGMLGVMKDDLLNWLYRIIHKK